MKLLSWVGGLVLLALAVCVVLIRSGAYDVAADEPHWTLTRSVMETVRTTSVERRSAHIEVPMLDDAALIYPAPPNFVTRPLENPAAAFWVIKHGIKMTGMPAWGKSMDDEYVWGLVAFLNQLPGMPTGRYRELVAASGGHRHGGSESGNEAGSSGPGHAPRPASPHCACIRRPRPGRERERAARREGRQADHGRQH